MDNGFHASGILLHNFHSICGSLSAVDDHRHIFFTGQFQLADKPLPLQIMSFFVPVVIQTDLSDSHDFFTIQQFSHSLKRLFIQRSHFIRMHADRSIHKRIFFRQFLYPVPGFNGRTGVYNHTDPLCFHLSQQLFPVDVKLFIIIMCMCIKNHNLVHLLHQNRKKRSRQASLSAGMLFFILFPSAENFNVFLLRWPRNSPRHPLPLFFTVPDRQSFRTRPMYMIPLNCRR